MNSMRLTPTPRTERLSSDVRGALKAAFERACRPAAGPLVRRHGGTGSTGQWWCPQNGAGRLPEVRPLDPKSTLQARNHDRGAGDGRQGEYRRTGVRHQAFTSPPLVWPPPGRSPECASGRAQGNWERRYLPTSLRPSTTVTAPYSGAALSHCNAQAFAASSSVALMCVDLGGTRSGSCRWIE